MPGAPHKHPFARWTEALRQLPRITAMASATPIRAPDAPLEDRFAEKIREAKTRRTSNRSQLLGILTETDRASLLSQAAITYLAQNPDSFRESENDRIPAHIEYLALQAAGVGLISDSSRIDPEILAEQTDAAIDHVRVIFKDSIALMSLRSMTDGPSATPHEMVNRDYQSRIRMDSLLVRGSAYPEHHKRVIHGCFDAFDDECSSLLGFTATEVMQLGGAVTRLWGERLEPRFDTEDAVARKLLRDTKRARRKGPSGNELVDELAKMSPRQARQMVSAKHFVTTFGDARSIACFTPRELAEAASVNESATIAFLEAFSFDEGDFDDERHRFPYGGQPLISTPVVKVDTHLFLMPVPVTFLESVRPRMGDLLSQYTNVWDRYLIRRSKFLEEESTRILTKMLPGATSWTRVPWSCPTTRGELDGLVACDDLALRVQAKSGRVDDSTRRGAPLRMKKDLDDLIGTAAEQHRRLATTLDSLEPEALGLEPDICRALKLPLQIELIVTLDAVSVWATEIHKLKSIAVVDTDCRVPWIVSLTDLMVIADILHGAHFVDYLLRRLRLEEQERISTYDELDWLGNYLDEGLFFDDLLSGDDAVDFVRLFTFTEDIDTWYFSRAGLLSQPVPKPHQAVPPHLKNLLERLQLERPRHWLLGSVCLLLGKNDSRKLLNDTFVRLATRPTGSKKADTSVVIEDICGVMVWVDHDIHTLDIASLVPAYARRKMADHPIENWLAITEGYGRELAVVAIPPTASVRIAERLLSPRTTRESD